MRFIVAATIFASACGYGVFGDEPGGASNLPTRGAGPYRKTTVDFDTPADEPFILADARASLSEPSTLVREDGGLRVWFTRQADDGAGEIWLAELPGIDALPDVLPALALAASESWEQGDVRAPTVIEQPDGALVMYYAGGTTAPAMGRADSSDGTRWTKHPGNPILLDAAFPAAVVVDELTYLAFARPGAGDIAIATSADGAEFSPARFVVGPRFGQIAFDSLSVGSPALVALGADFGPPELGMFFTGERPGQEPGERVSAIGYLGSRDGVSWQRFGDGSPVLHPDAPGESGPSAQISATRGILIFDEVKQGRGRIAAAVHP